MFQIDDDMIIYVTRGDVGYFSVTADNNGTTYIFRKGDVVQIKVTKKKDCTSVVLQKDFAVTEDTERVNIFLTESDTRIGDVISKPVDYWYEITLNPYTNPQTIVGYDDDGAKIFKLFPEGKEQTVNGEIDEGNVPAADRELSLISQRPVENRVVAQAMLKLDEKIEQTNGSVGKITDEVKFANVRLQNLFSAEEGNTDFEREVADMRVGVDGTVYPTAGDAVREQVKYVVETADRLNNVVVTVNKADTLYPAYCRMNISNYKVGDVIGREVFEDSGHGFEYGDIRAVKKGNIFTLENNDSKEEYEEDKHGVLVCDENHVITKIITGNDLKANGWRYIVEADGYLYIAYKALNVAHEIIEYENFVDEFDRRCNELHEKCEVLERKVGAPSVFVVTVTTSGNSFIADKTHSEILEAYNSGKIIYAVKNNAVHQMNSEVNNTFIFRGYNVTNGSVECSQIMISPLMIMHATSSLTKESIGKDYTYNELKTENKTIVGAINEIVEKPPNSAWLEKENIVIWDNITLPGKGKSLTMDFGDKRLLREGDVVNVVLNNETYQFNTLKKEDSSGIYIGCGYGFGNDDVPFTVTSTEGTGECYVDFSILEHIDILNPLLSIYVTRDVVKSNCDFVVREKHFSDGMDEVSLIVIEQGNYTDVLEKVKKGMPVTAYAYLEVIEPGYVWIEGSFDDVVYTEDDGPGVLVLNNRNLTISADNSIK